MAITLGSNELPVEESRSSATKCIPLVEGLQFTLFLMGTSTCFPKIGPYLLLCGRLEQIPNVTVCMRSLETVTAAGASAHKCCVFDTLLLESLLSGIAELHRIFIIAHSKRLGNAICKWLCESALEK
jgi:hypothetical protein